MASILRLSSTRVFAEIAIIVAGVLMAFWLEAWWTNQRASEEERAILAPVRVEVEQIAEQSDGMHKATQAMYESTLKLANYALHGYTEEDDDDINKLVGDFTFRINENFTYAPVLESLFFTGDLEKISNNGLRQSVSEFQVHLGWLRAEIERESEYFNERVIPYLQKNADIAQYYSNEIYAPGFWGDPDYESSYPGLEPTAIRSQASLLESREFHNILLHRLTTLGTVMWQFEDSEISEKGKRIQALIDEELERL